MKKPLFWIIVFLFSAISANSQTIKGVITDEDDVKLKNVQISLSGINLLWFTDANGRFEIPNLPDSNYRLTAVLNGFDTLYTDFDKRQNSNLRIVMISSAFLQEAASIKVYRAKYTTPIAYQNLSREAINRNNLGQDLPILLNVTPSAVATSDAGAGIGYTGLRIRGSDGTRINVTVNGIPLNDAESQGVYWVNMPDFSSSLGSVQIQRGVGTSTNGTGAFGASINLQSTTPDTAAYGEFNNTFGSFNTIKNTLKIGTGTINKFWNFNGRISRIVSDGYIDRASSSLQSYYFSGRYSKKKTVVEAITFGGSEKTYQSWYGTPESRLNNDSNAMIEHAANNNYTEAQKNNLLNAGRTYNYYLYSNETDNYKQNHYQLLSTHAFSKKFSGNAALHYTRGQGYYEQSKQGQNFSDYGVRNTITTNDTITHTDLIRRRWLDNHFYGAIGSLSYSVKKLKVIAGGGWNVYRGRHFGKVIWAEFADNLPYDYRYYLSHSYKRDANAYIKGEFTASKKLNIFGDVQIRSVKYSGNGTDQDNVIIDFGKTYLFFNPKGGVSYSVNSKNILYGSLSIANREPVRGDFVDNKLSSLPKPEHLTDIEIGYKFRGRAMFFNANAYLMSYKDQLVVTGELNDVGSSIRRNVNKSYRAGIEFIASAEILKNLRWDGNLTFSDNRIKQFDEVLYNYDSGRSEINSYKNVQIAFSPGVIAYSGFTYSVRSFGITFMSKYVGRQYLDNTGHESRSLPSYFVNDVRLDYTPKIFGIKKLKATLLVNNVFSTLYSSNGYTYSYIYGKTVTENFYYPQAKINFLAALSLSF